MTGSQSHAQSRGMVELAQGTSQIFQEYSRKLMRLYEEYSSKLPDSSDDESNSQLVGNLTYTQAPPPGVFTALETGSETITGQLTKMEEEHSGEVGYFAELDKVNKGNVQTLLKEIKSDKAAQEEIKVLKTYFDLIEKQAETNKAIKDVRSVLDTKLYAKYPTLTKDEIKALVVDDKWMASMERNIHTEMDRSASA